ncbi:hypothetical protein HK104_001754 [Borealophlyctis nickersoniae]|nr:hypothetical protein HK104_001754 [Borealophlyctis nickersoniae]
MNPTKATIVQNTKAFGHDSALEELSSLDDMRPFGRSSLSVFFGLDQLRRMQINLALEHLNLESLPLSSHDAEADDDSSRRYRRNAERFAKKETDVNNLMLKLEELSEAM